MASPLTRGRGPWLGVIAIAAMSFVLSLAVGNHFFNNLSANNDEPVYVLQADLFRHGHVTLSAPAQGDAFRPWMSGRKDDRLLLVVQPVLPAVMAFTDLVFGSTRIALALIAAGAVIAIFSAARQLLRDDRTALVAAAVFALSPLVIVQSALYLSYVFAVLLASTVIALAGRAMDTRRWRWMAAAGFVQGLLFFLRPIEGLMLGLVLLIWMAVSLGAVRLALRNAVVMAAGALPVLALCLAYNLATTGNPLKFPLWAIGGNDAFGFGDRTIAEGGRAIHFGPGESFLALRTNLRAFPHWLLGGLVSLPLLVWGAVILWRTRRKALLMLGSIAVIYPAGYCLYYGNYLIIGGKDLYGPHYYLGLLIPATMLMAVAIVDVVRRRALLAALLVPLVILGTVVEAGDKIRRNERVRDDIAREVNAVRSSVRGRAVVVVPDGEDGAYVLHPRGALGNSAELSDVTLFAADLGGRNLELFDRFPDRAVYRLQTVSDGRTARPDVGLLRRVRAPSLDLTIRAKPLPDRPVFVTYAAVANQADRVCVVDRAATPDRAIAARVRMSPTAVTLLGCEGGDVTVPLPGGPSTVVLGAASSAKAELATGSQVESRYWVRLGDGAVDVITPPATWRWDPAAGFSLIDPSAAPWVTFDVRAP
ncbi:MAG: hypothetical protein QOJ67_2897 [Acidimicrobiaceae bacterium]